jgi:putative SOS response-associated peptidase YedK
MCGRFVFFELDHFIEELRKFDIPFTVARNFSYAASYNIAPQSDIVTLLGDHERYTLSSAHWGLIPEWAAELPAVRPINARSESLAVKPYFRHMLNRHHCLIPSSGFYEWKRVAGSKKQPFYIHRKDGMPIAFAGLWDSWRQEKSGTPPLVSCAIITTGANNDMMPVHDRMPVILEPGQWRLWLESGKPGATSLLNPLREGLLDIYPVSTRVNNPQYVRRDCISRAEEEG